MAQEDTKKSPRVRWGRHMPGTKTVNVEQVSAPVWVSFRAYCVQNQVSTGVALSQVLARFLAEQERRMREDDERDN